MISTGTNTVALELDFKDSGKIKLLVTQLNNKLILDLPDIDQQLFLQ